MLVSPKMVLLLDEISTGLDSSTTFQICQCLANLAALRRCTVLVSLLQPAPETFALFSDVLLLSEGGTPRPGGPSAQPAQLWPSPLSLLQRDGSIVPAPSAVLR